MSRGQEARVVLLKDAQNGGQAAAARGGYEVGEGVLGVGGLVVRKHDCCQRLRRQQGRCVASRAWKATAEAGTGRRSG